VSVWGTSDLAGYRGPYRLQTYAINRRPEATGDTVAVGDTIAGESLQVPGDIDDYVLYGAKGRHLVAYLQGLAGPGHGSFGLTISPPDSGSQLRAICVPASSVSLDSGRTNRLDIASPGWYRLSVRPCQSGHSPAELGAYRFAVIPFDASPEVAPRQVSVGDSIGSERIDYADDMDEFVLSGSPAVEFAVFAQGTMQLEVYDTTTQDSVRTVASSGYFQSSGRIVLPVAGVLGLRVTGQPGSYWFKIFPINRAPESVSGDVTIGDTVTGEALFPVSDVDEFYFSGSAGEHVAVYFQTQGVLDADGVLLEVVDTSSSTLLGTVTSINPTGNLEDLSTGLITLPVTGSYLVRVRGVSDRSGATFGTYRFRVTTLP
jgi:hypothetical protein